MNTLICSNLFATFALLFMAKKVLHLDLAADFHLWALVSPLRDYRLVYFLNKLTGLGLRRLPDHTVALPRQQGEADFTRYGYYSGVDHLLFYILLNKTNQGKQYLVPEYKQVDSWLLIKGDEGDWQAPVIEKMRRMNQLQTIFPVNPLALQSQHNLIFDDEDLHSD